MIAENASGAVAKTEAGTSRGRGGVIVTVTSVTELTGVKSPVLYVTVSCANPIYRDFRCLIVYSSTRHHSVTVRPKSDGWEGNPKVDAAVSATFESQLPVRCTSFGWHSPLGLIEMYKRNLAATAKNNL